LLTACFSPWKGTEATLIINFDGNNGRYVQWPPYNKDNVFINNMKFIITLESKSDNIVEMKSFTEGDPISNANFEFIISPGNWKISIKNYIGESFLCATFSDNIYVKAGQNSIKVQMKKAYFEIGDIGPGGGKVFFCDIGGFTMTDTGKICHYLEAAPEDLDGTFKFDPDDTYNISASNGDTSDGLGTGMQNTKNIISITENNLNTAAYAAYNYGTGWFLPSKDELEIMGDYENENINNTEKKLGLAATSYKSSSDDDSMYRWTLIYVAVNSRWVISSDQDYPYNVRPIRAF